MHQTTVHDKPSQVVLLEHLCDVAALQYLKNENNNRRVAASGCSCWVLSGDE